MKNYVIRKCIEVVSVVIAILGFIALAWAVLAHAATVEVKPLKTPQIALVANVDIIGPAIAPNASQGQIEAKGSVLNVAQTLYNLFGSRPYWQGPKIDPKNVPSDEVDTIISHLIPCESGGVDVDKIDSNGIMSYGILQFQNWPNWEAMSGLGGSPDNAEDAIRMAEWAISHGHLNAWTCARILKISQ